MLRTSAEYGPSNHRGDTERGASTSGTGARSTVSGTEQRRGRGTGEGGGGWLLIIKLQFKQIISWGIIFSDFLCVYSFYLYISLSPWLISCCEWKKTLVLNEWRRWGAGDVSAGGRDQVQARHYDWVMTRPGKEISVMMRTFYTFMSWCLTSFCQSRGSYRGSNHAVFITLASKSWFFTLLSSGGIWQTNVSSMHERTWDFICFELIERWRTNSLFRDSLQTANYLLITKSMKKDYYSRSLSLTLVPVPSNQSWIQDTGSTSE